jgi:hypothetical protein
VSKTAKQVAAKIVALMVADWQRKDEIVEVRDVEHDGQSVTVRDTLGEEDFTITVHRRSASTPIAATVDERTDTEREADEQAAAARSMGDQFDEIPF